MLCSMCACACGERWVLESEADELPTRRSVRLSCTATSLVLDPARTPTVSPGSNSNALMAAARLPEDDAEEVDPSMEMEGVLLLNVAVVLTTAGAITSGDADGDAAGQSSAPTYAMRTYLLTEKHKTINRLERTSNASVAGAGAEDDVRLVDRRLDTVATRARPRAQETCATATTEIRARYV